MQGQYQPQQHKPWKEWDSNFSVHQLREMQAQERKLRDIANGMVGQQRIDMVMDACYRKCMYEGAQKSFDVPKGFGQRVTTAASSALSSPAVCSSQC